MSKVRHQNWEHAGISSELEFVKDDQYILLLEKIMKYVGNLCKYDCADVVGEQYYGRRIGKATNQLSKYGVSKRAELRCYSIKITAKAGDPQIVVFYGNRNTQSSRRWEMRGKENRSDNGNSV